MKSLLKGIEEEVYAGRPTGEILPISPEVTAALPGFVREPDSRNIEYTTSPSADYDALGDQLRERRCLLDRYLRQRGRTRIPGSCMSLPFEQRFLRSTPDNPYHGHIEESYGTRVVTTSCHININVEDVETMMRAYRVIRLEAPLYLALSAASPFLNGKVTGAHSTRWQVFPKTPADVPLFSSYSHYCDWMQQQLAAGSMYNLRHLWLSVRPNGVQPLENVERLELRVCDQIDDLPVLLAVTAMLEARVLQVIADPSLEPLTVDWLPADGRENALLRLAAANEAAVARTSLHAAIRDWRTGALVPARAAVEAMIAEVKPAAIAAGFDDRLDALQCVLRRGNPAQRWLRRVAAGESIADIVADQIQHLPEVTSCRGCDAVV
jgi:predicted glutamate--cysteine ligase